MIGMTSSDHRTLPPELVALIHHVELSESGWYDQLIDQLVLSHLFLGDSPCTLDDLKAGLQSNLGFAADETTLRKSIARLKKSRKLAGSSNRSFALTELAMRETQAAVTENDLLDERVSQRFKQLVREEVAEIDPHECWVSFCRDCLDPLVTKLGARTYQLIVSTENYTPDVYSIASCTDKYPPNVRDKVHKLLDRFLDPENQDVRNFVLNRLHCYLLTLTVSISEDSLSRLVTKSKSNLQLKLFLDTNFMFSLLELHEHPANPVAKDLTNLLKNIENHVRSRLYVFPPTIDEANRTLKAAQRELDDIEISPRLGRIMRATMRRKPSGIKSRYLCVAAASSQPLSARQYLGIYLSDLISVLRGFNVDLFNQNIDSILESDEVDRDVQDLQSFLIEHPWERQKSIDTIRHDVTLWHFVSKKRSVRVDSPLDAVYWVVTVDHGLIRFDRHKVDYGNDVSVPICVHPATLIQMLRLWTPRSTAFDTAMLNCVRSLLPQAHETDMEAVTFKILRTLARFEGVDQLPEATVSSVLFNRAVRAGMEGMTGPVEQNQLIREALLDELKSARREIDDVRSRESEKDEKLKKALSQTHELMQLRRLDEKTVKQLESDLHNERKWRKRLTSEVDDVNQKYHSKRIEHDRFMQKIFRIVFSIFTLVVTPVLMLSFVLIGELAGNQLGYQGHRSMTIGAVLGWVLAVVLIRHVGVRINQVQSWSVFQWFLRKVKTVFAILGAIVVSVVSELFLEYW